MNPPLSQRRTRDLGPVDPAAIAEGLKDRPGALVLTSGEAEGRTLLACDPDRVFVGPMADDRPFAVLADPAWGPGTVGLAAYDAGARPAVGARGDWPDLMLARYPAMLQVDVATGHAVAVGRGGDAAAAEAAVQTAASWLKAARPPVRPGPPADDFVAEASGATYRDAVADVVARIGAGELFQANLARAWRGTLRPGATPFDVFARLAGRASAYGAVWRLGDRAVVSNSPELFLTLDRWTGRVETRPIKGTRPRRADPAEDAAEAEALLASAKDRAENLMIVDLMRNDLARACRPGSVRAERLFDLERHPTVHHLVSTVTGQLAPGADAAALMAAAFPPGSITGAPKHQAMKVIADHEAPRGPWCGSLFLVEEARFTASVLIRTAAFDKDASPWRWRALAGAGITADSDPQAELEETGAKISALKAALSGP